MVVDYDFIVGKQRLRGAGWRGLVALFLWFALRLTITIIIVIWSKPVADRLLPLVQRLAGF